MEEPVATVDEEAEEGPADTIGTNLRGSRQSTILYGPRTSVRSGRPDRLSQIRSSVAGEFVGLDAEKLAQLQADDDDDEETGAAGGGCAPLASPHTAAMTDESLFVPTISQQRRLLKKIAAAAVTSDRTGEVTVCLRNVSYHVSVQLDAPTKETVVNQSICYVTWEFFQRFGNWLRSTCSRTNNENDTVHRKYMVRNVSDMFVPFHKVPILRKVNLVLRPGKTYVVLGPPASGKTTLLRAIAGRLPHFARTTIDGAVVPFKSRPHISGRMDYNGVVAFPTVTDHDDEDSAAAVSIGDDHGLILPNVVSFVGQLDVHAPYMTVKETFDFALACRRGDSDPEETEPTDPSTLTNTEESNDDSNITSTTISENLTTQGLGLAHVENTFVGNENVRGVSGGQRRRVTIGEMMQGNTPVACADEVSTGLDAAVTYDICRSMVSYSKAAMTTRIVSLLQPGPETFSLFDEAIVLAEGYVVYAGPVPDVVPYFERLGYFLPATMDVADFLQAVPTPDGALLFDPDRSPQNSHYTASEFALAFQKSQEGQRIKEALRDQQSPSPSNNSWTKRKNTSGGDGGEDDDDDDDDDKIFSKNNEATTIVVPERFQREFQHSWFRSFQLNFHRHLLLWWRDKAFIIGKSAENIGMAVATGGILFGRGKLPSILSRDFVDWTEEEAVALQELQDGIFSALFMATLHILLGTSTSTPDDIDGRPIHYKHADANFYHTTAFVAGRLASTLPQRAMEIVAFGIPVYFMVGLDVSARSFFLYLLILLMYTFTLKILFGVIAQVLPNKQNVLSFGTFLVLVGSLFSGFIVYPDTIPGFYEWIFYINPMSWTLQAMLINEFTSDKYKVSERMEFVARQQLEVRGFESGKEYIGYCFAFLIPFALLWAGVLSLVLKKVRIEAKRNVEIKKEGSKAKTKDADGSGLEDFNLPFVPVDLTFEDLVYEVKASTGDETIRLLNKVSGAFRSGRMCALMGSSGAGKTTLMDVIALRKTSGTITGDVRMNGFEQERTSFLRSSGYVEQFDVQQAEVTVRETVVFSARLRLSRDNPLTSTDEGRLKFVEYVLDTLELTDIQHLQVGSYEEGGLSFEQRKRLAIAVELAASPSVIFLDEPTSGLDARGALVVMRAMKRIADTGRTVCATIHQPSGAVFEMFDDLLLLKRGGEVVFFGDLGTESCHLVDYFENHGSEKICHGENPAAWMLRAYTREDDNKDWKDLFEQSDQYRTLKETLRDIKEGADESKRIQYDKVFAASLRTQMTLMIRRVFRMMMRAPSYNLARLMIALFYSVLLGTMFLGAERQGREFQQNEVDGILSTIFLGLIIIGVGSVSMAVPVMKQVRDVFYKHRASGMLDHNSVAMAVTLGELPYILVIAAVFSSSYYSLVELFDTVNKWLWFFMFFALNMGSYTYFGQAFMCMVRDVNTAGALVGALIGYNVFFSGLVVRPQYFVGPFQLGYWTAPGRFAFEGIVVTQFRELDYTVIAEVYSPFFYHLGCEVPDGEAAEQVPSCTGTLEEYVDFFFGGRFKESNLPLDIGVMFFCLFLARFFCWISLWKLNYVNT